MNQKLQVFLSIIFFDNILSIFRKTNNILQQIIPSSDTAIKNAITPKITPSIWVETKDAKAVLK